MRARAGDMHLVVGLGNVGARYEGTRHNVGFRVLDALAERNGIEIKKKRFYSLVGTGTVCGCRTTLCRPTTLMNGSGVAVAELLKAKRYELGQVMIVCDDMSLPVGKIRIRPDGGTGGHKGLESVTEWLESDAYPRLRVGIGERGRMEGADYVLSPFKRSELTAVEESVSLAAEAIETWLARGIEAAMNRYN